MVAPSLQLYGANCKRQQATSRPMDWNHLWDLQKRLSRWCKQSLSQMWIKSKVDLLNGHQDYQAYIKLCHVLKRPTMHAYGMHACMPIWDLIVDLVENMPSFQFKFSRVIKDGSSTKDSRPLRYLARCLDYLDSRCLQWPIPHLRIDSLPEIIVKLSSDREFSAKRGVRLLSLWIIVSLRFLFFVVLRHDWTNAIGTLPSNLYLFNHALLSSFTIHLLLITMRFVRRPIRCTAVHTILMSETRTTAIRQKENTFNICPKFALYWNPKEVKETFVLPHCILHLHLWASLKLQYKSYVPEFNYDIVFNACFHWENRFLPRCHNLQMSKYDFNSKGTKFWSSHLLTSEHKV